MQLLDFLKERDIYLDSESETILDVLKELSLKFDEPLQNTIYDLLVEREEQSSTAICNEVAIPHCKVSQIDQIKIIVLKTKKAFDCASHDEKLTRLFFLIISNHKKNKEHIKLLAKIGRMIKDHQNVKELLSAETSWAFYKKLEEFDT